MLPVKAWMLEHSEAQRGIICGVERGSEGGLPALPLRLARADEWHKLARPHLLLQHIFTAYCMTFLQNRTKAVFQWSRSNGTSHNCQLLDLWIYIGRGGLFPQHSFPASNGQTHSFWWVRAWPLQSFQLFSDSPENCCLKSIGLKLMDPGRSNLINEYPRRKTISLIDVK